MTRSRTKAVASSTGSLGLDPDPQTKTPTVSKPNPLTRGPNHGVLLLVITTSPSLKHRGQPIQSPGIEVAADYHGAPDRSQKGAAFWVRVKYSTLRAGQAGEAGQARETDNSQVEGVLERVSPSINRNEAQSKLTATKEKKLSKYGDLISIPELL